jgi:hypothetical protein
VQVLVQFLPVEKIWGFFQDMICPHIPVPSDEEIYLRRQNAKQLEHVNYGDEE